MCPPKTKSSDYEGFPNKSIAYGLRVLWDKVARSLGMIGLGVLLLAGGWVLEKMRRRLMSRMDAAEATHGEAQ